MSSAPAIPGTIGRDRFDAIRDAYLFLYLFYLFKVTTQGASLEHSDPTTYFNALGNTGGDMMQQGMVFLGLAVGGIACRRKGIPFAILPSLLLPFLLYIGLALFSVVWSDFPALTVRRSLRLALELLAVATLALSYRDELARFVRILFFGLLLMTLGSFAMLALPSRSFTVVGFIGVFSHKLYVGQMANVAAPVFVVALLNREVSGTRLLPLAGLFCLAVILGLSRSKTAWVCIPLSLMMATAAVMAFRDKRLHLLGIGVALLAGIVSFGVITGFISPDYLSEALFKDSSLTGRDVIWKFIFDHIDGKETLGVGYGALWQTGPEVVSRMRNLYRIYAVNTAHNGYIETYAQLGIPGTIVLFASLALILKRIVRLGYASSQGQEVILFLGVYFFCAALFMNTTDTSYFYPNLSLWLIFVSVMVLASDALHRIQSGPGSPIGSWRAGSPHVATRYPPRPVGRAR